MIYNKPRAMKRETWLINEEILDTVDWTNPAEYSIRFISNRAEFSSIVIGGDKKEFSPKIFYGSKLVAYGYEGTFTVSEWVDDAYRTITFLESPTGDLLTWLQENAVKQ
mgnify:CR=1 FL=1|nr:MAG TPA: hypothetical protein [Caudoviricetes sp.]